MTYREGRILIEREKLRDIRDGLIGYIDSLIDDLNVTRGKIQDLFKFLEENFAEEYEPGKTEKVTLESESPSKPRKPSGRKITQGQLDYLKKLYRGKEDYF